MKSLLLFILASAIPAIAYPHYPINSPSCPRSNGKTYEPFGPRGPKFEIECGVDYYDSDLDMVYVNSFGECMRKCAKSHRCNAVAMRGTACYLKSAARKIKKHHDRHVSSAKKINGRPSTLCPTENGRKIKMPCGSEYLVECASDRNGGDRPVGNPIHTHSLKECIKECDKDHDCVNVNWIIGQGKGLWYVVQNACLFPMSLFMLPIFFTSMNRRSMPLQSTACRFAKDLILRRGSLPAWVDRRLIPRCSLTS